MVAKGSSIRVPKRAGQLTGTKLQIKGSHPDEMGEGAGRGPERISSYQWMW